MNDTSRLLPLVVHSMKLKFEMGYVVQASVTVTGGGQEGFPAERHICAH
jgi:hypothetical protein